MSQRDDDIDIDDYASGVLRRGPTSFEMNWGVDVFHPLIVWPVVGEVIKLNLEAANCGTTLAVVYEAIQDERLCRILTPEYQEAYDKLKSEGKI